MIHHSLTRNSMNEVPELKKKVIGIREEITYTYIVIQSLLFFRKQPGPSDTKENLIIDLKLEYSNFRAKTSKSLSHTYTSYKTLFNELSNDGVQLSKHELNVGFVNNFPEKYLNFSQGL
ncbi:hypothetical protein Tco_0942248 [Tanacetum coccineum]